jgi:hypothetical protein
MGLEPADLQERVFGRPLLSDGGLPLQSYGCSHAQHYACFRYLLESLGFGSYVVMLPRPLLFAAREVDYVMLRAQAVVSLASGIAAGIITTNAACLFRKTFGIAIDYYGKLTALEKEPFRDQAISGDGGLAGAATCSNHVEGLHGRLNQATSGKKLLHRRIKSIIEQLTAKAANFRAIGGWDVAMSIGMGRIRSIRAGGAGMARCRPPLLNRRRISFISSDASAHLRGHRENAGGCQPYRFRKTRK